MRLAALLLALAVAWPAAAQDAAPKKKKKPAAAAAHKKPSAEQIRKFNELEKKKKQ